LNSSCQSTHHGYTRQKVYEKAIQEPFRSYPCPFVSCHQRQNTGMDGIFVASALSPSSLRSTAVGSADQHHPKTDEPSEKEVKIKSLKPCLFQERSVQDSHASCILGYDGRGIQTGKKLPVLPALVLVGVLLSLFFEESCGILACPYGTILSLRADLPKRPWSSIHYCAQTAPCTKGCPSGAIVREEKHRIIKSECLVCHESERVCNKGAISSSNKHGVDVHVRERGRAAALPPWFYTMAGRLLFFLAEAEDQSRHIDSRPCSPCVLCRTAAAGVGMMTSWPGLSLQEWRSAPCRPFGASTTRLISSKLRPVEAG
jgi:ferredoxin